MYNRLAITGTDVVIPKIEDSTPIPLIKGLPHEDTSKLTKQESYKKKENILRDLKMWSKNGVNNVRFNVIKKQQIAYNIFKITVQI